MIAVRVGLSRVASAVAALAMSSVPSVDTALMMGGAVAIVGGLYGFDPRIASVTFGVMCLVALYARRATRRSA